jgi:uncharacterized repeat protein (TIGR01451 family)
MPHQPHTRRPAPRSGILSVTAAVAALSPGLVIAEPPEAGPDEAIAVGSAPLKTEVIVETLLPGDDPERASGRRFVPASRIRAGDEVHYTIRVTNPSRTPVTGVMVTKRLPFGLTYVGGSAVGPAATIHFSADGGESFAAAASLEVVSGGQTRRAAPADYTHVRWLLKRPLAPGATALLRFRATLG